MNEISTRRRRSTMLKVVCIVYSVCSVGSHVTKVQQHCTDCCLRFTLWKTTEFFYSAFPKYNCKNAFLMYAVFVGLSSYNNQTNFFRC